MGYLCALLCGGICVFSYVRYKNIYHPIVSFSFLFFIVSFMSSLRLFEFYAAPDFAYLIILFGVICFSVGAIISDRVNIVFGKHNNFTQYELNKTIYFVMIFICLLIIVPRFLTIGKYLLLGHSVGDVYVTLAGSVGAETEDLAQSSLQALLIQFVGYPILYIIVPTSVLLFFRTFEKKYLIIATGLGLLRVLLDSRRTYLISLFIFFLVSFLLYQNKKELMDEKIVRKLEKIKKWIPIILILIIAAFEIVSRSRSNTFGQQSSFLGTFYNYYAGCVQYLGKCIDSYAFEHTYGFTTLRGLFAPFFGVLKIFGIDPIHPYQVATDIVNGMKYVVIQIGPGIRYNSFTTCFYQFYCDGGFFGIAFLSVAFGFYSEALYKRFLYDNQLRFEVRYLYFYGTILMLSFTNMRTILAFILWPLIIERFMYKRAE